MIATGLCRSCEIGRLRYVAYERKTFCDLLIRRIFNYRSDVCVRATSISIRIYSLLIAHYRSLIAHSSFPYDIIFRLCLPALFIAFRSTRIHGVRMDYFFTIFSLLLIPPLRLLLDALTRRKSCAAGESEVMFSRNARRIRGSCLHSIPKIR